MTGRSVQMKGVHASIVVLAGVVALNAGNYVFHLLAARSLGTARYGDLAALIALASLIALPLGGIQLWVARYVARFAGEGDTAAVRWFVRRTMLYAVAAGMIGTTVLVLVALPLQNALGVASIAAVVVTALTTFPAVTSQISWGLAQGLQRFGLVAATYAGGAIARVALTAGAFGVGLQVGGAMLATLASMFVALALPLYLLRDWFRSGSDATRRVTRLDARRSLFPVVLGLLAITALTSVDVIVAKAALSEHEAGIYGSASLIGRVLLYLPAAVATVLLPRVASRVGDAAATTHILRRSVAATVVFCLGLTAAYAVASDLIVTLAFGAAYEDAASLLWLFGLAMTGYALINVLLVFHLGHERAGFVWVLVAAAVAQILVFFFVHASPRHLVLVDIAVAAAVIAAHELVTRGLLTRALTLTRSR